MIEIEIQRIDPAASFVETTPEDVARYAMAHGTIVTLTMDGKLYRVLNPWDSGADITDTP